MRNSPSGAALLEIARSSLLEELAPSLKGQKRYIALMVANAMGIVARELEQATDIARAQEALTACAGGGTTEFVYAQRAGRWDGNASLHQALTTSVEIAAQIWKPGAAPKRA